MIKSLGLFIPPLKELDFVFEFLDFLVHLEAGIHALSRLCIVVSVFVLCHGVFSHTKKSLAVASLLGLVEINSSERESFGKSSSVGFDAPVFDDQSSFLIVFRLLDNTRLLFGLSCKRDYWRICQVLVVAI